VCFILNPESLISYLLTQYFAKTIKQENDFFNRIFQPTFISFLKSIIQKINFLNFMVIINNIKNNRFYCINGNLDLYTHGVYHDIIQNIPFYTK